MAIRNLFPEIKPSLNLDFANTRQLDPRITFSRATSGTYFDSNGVMQLAPAGVVRFDYVPADNLVTGVKQGEFLRLLIEESRQNLLYRSSDFSDSYWTKTNCTVSADSTASPDGTLTGDKLIADSGIAPGGTAEAYQSVTAAAGTYTYSLHLKAAGFSSVTLAIRDSASSVNYARVTVSLTDGSTTSAASIGGTFTGATSTVTPVGNGWYRVSLTTTTTGASAIRCRVWNQSGTGDGYSGIYIWGAQLEAGADATSYIPTVASQVTRAADTGSFTTSTNGTFLIKNASGVWSSSEKTAGVVVALSSCKTICHYPKTLSAAQISALTA